MRGALEVYNAALLLDRERGDPYRNEAILPEWKTETWMASNIKGQLSVASSVRQLMPWRAAQWNAAKNEGAGMVGEFLLPSGPLLTDQLYSLELFQPTFRKTNGWQK